MRLDLISKNEVGATDQIPDATKRAHYLLWFAFFYAARLIGHAAACDSPRPERRQLRLGGPAGSHRRIHAAPRVQVYDVGSRKRYGRGWHSNEETYNTPSVRHFPELLPLKAHEVVRMDLSRHWWHHHTGRRRGPIQLAFSRIKAESDRPEYLSSHGLGRYARTVFLRGR